MVVDLLQNWDSSCLAFCLFCLFSVSWSFSPYFSVTQNRSSQWGLCYFRISFRSSPGSWLMTWGWLPFPLCFGGLRAYVCWEDILATICQPCNEDLLMRHLADAFYLQRWQKPPLGCAQSISKASGLIIVINIGYTEAHFVGGLHVAFGFLLIVSFLISLHKEESFKISVPLPISEMFCFALMNFGKIICYMWFAAIRTVDMIFRFFAPKTGPETCIWPKGQADKFVKGSQRLANQRRLLLDGCRCPLPLWTVAVGQG